MKDLLNIGVVNFKTVWGDKSANLAHMEAYVTEAAGRGCEFIVFPETALTGYSSEPDVSYEKKMHVVNAETIPGPATEKMAELSGSPLATTPIASRRSQDTTAPKVQDLR